MRRQFIWISSGRAVAAVLQAVFLVLVARALGPAEFGLYSLVFSTLIIAQVISEAGLGTLIIRERSANPVSSIVGPALRLSNLTALWLATVGVISIAALGAVGENLLFALIPLAISSALERNADLWMGVALADGDTVANVFNLILRRALGLVILMGFLLISLTPMLAVSCSALMAAALSSIAAHRYVASRVDTRGYPVKARIIVAASWPYWLNSLSGQLRNLDMIIITSLSGSASAGLYAAAGRLTGPLLLIPTSISAVILPAAARHHSTQLSQPAFSARRLIVLTSIAMSVMYLALAIGAPIYFPLLVGAEFGKSVPVFQIILIGLCFSASTTLVSSVLQGRGNPAAPAKAALVAGIFSIILIAVGVKVFGIQGAAAGLALSFVMQLVLLLLFSRSSPKDDMKIRMHS